jgi:hypothetical protein
MGEINRPAPTLPVRLPQDLFVLTVVHASKILGFQPVAGTIDVAARPAVDRCAHEQLR